MQLVVLMSWSKAREKKWHTFKILHLVFVCHLSSEDVQWDIAVSPFFHRLLSSDIFCNAFGAALLGIARRGLQVWHLKKTCLFSPIGLRTQ